MLCCCVVLMSQSICNVKAHAKVIGAVEIVSSSRFSQRKEDDKVDFDKVLRVLFNVQGCVHLCHCCYCNSYWFFL